MNLASIPQVIADLQRRPDLNAADYQFLSIVLKTIDRLSQERLLAEKIEIWTMLEEMVIRVRNLWRRYHESNVVVLDPRRRYEDDPEAVEIEKRRVG